MKLQGFFVSRSALALGLSAAVLAAGCATAGGAQQLEVTATAYNSLRAQTNDRPTLTAWGDRLKPGVKAIAVSRDLIPLGLGHGTRVTIDGLTGEYRVLDKMAKRWKRKIDIYMGEDVQAAKEWGVRKVTIQWKPRK